jgi:hypothetical protein
MSILDTSALFIGRRGRAITYTPRRSQYFLQNLLLSWRLWGIRSVPAAEISLLQQILKMK